MGLAIIDRTTDLKMKEKNGVVFELTRKVDVHGLTSTDYSVLLESLAQAGVPVAGSPLVLPNLRRSHPFGMLVLAERSVKVDIDDNSKAEVMLEYRHFLDQQNQDISQMSLNLPSWQPSLALGASQGPPGAYIGWFSVFGKSKTSVQQTKTNFGYREYSINTIPEWRIRFNYEEWQPHSYYIRPSIVRYNGVTWICRADPAPIGVPPSAGPNWRVAQASEDYTPADYPIGTVVQYRGFFWINTELVSTGVPGVSPAWRLARPGADYPVAAGSRERYVVTVAHKFPADDPDVGGKTLYQTGEITVMDPNRHYKVDGQVFTATPWRVANNIIGRVNKFPWMDGGIDEWMCTEVSWEAVFIRRKYSMSFEFQQNPDTWQPTAVFLDRRTGKPPPNLVENFGYRTVAYHAQVDFNHYFQSNFEL